ncbi:cytochrome c-type biogenesis protein CcmH [Ancylobacter aquaticus]|uniref:Cytochrome c-type biogenesis protein CcmH n=1 Tax=Ancylobacter aquaticus TaxID=100 RepID=A0A4V2PK72_ANCAQ|nr:c-type cytochrome biogenesis protein CcmI [Ancylobacter aquaticus]TCK31316.1 cytochrome c-type biogenesis protein CcmH [Ancylobacter aquaticus]
MLLWIAFSLMTGAAIMAVLWPLRTGAALPAASTAEADLAVYRDQLTEIERDRASGLIAPAEGEAARTEVARRILRASAERSREGASSGDDRRRRLVAVVALLGVPLMAGGLYLALGSPLYPPQPLAQRLEAQPNPSDVAILIRKVESHLEANPNDGRGYEVVAPIYARIGRLDDAARAWANAIRLLGPTAPRETGLGEALTAQAGGVVTTQAKTAFEAALTADPKDPKAQYFLGLAAEQDGRKAEAAARWSALVAQSPADAPWLGLLREALARIGAPMPATLTAPAAGPGAADVAAAESLTPEQRDAMVRGMVERLEARLTQEGDDIEGWLRLMRAWTVLGQQDKARVAAGQARTHFTSDSGALGRIDALAHELGLGS